MIIKILNFWERRNERNIEKFLLLKISFVKIFIFILFPTKNQMGCGGSYSRILPQSPITQKMNVARILLFSAWIVIVFIYLFTTCEAQYL